MSMNIIIWAEKGEVDVDFPTMQTPTTTTDEIYFSPDPVAAYLKWVRYERKVYSHANEFEEWVAKMRRNGFIVKVGVR